MKKPLAGSVTSVTSEVTLAEILKEWDGVELMDGVAMAAKARRVSSLTQFLSLTTEVEKYWRIHGYRLKERSR